ncbi:hypothetical protein CKA52_23555 [Pseudomonas aeruginosa]|nr:hypothetical protein [Pseudomonas aeruginosa]RKF98816.1 hypothetical protein CKA48_27855 [Pseudomonas aeruginosa]RKG14279.1 hypothetical protein CKA43_07490 [Pseudomonas aeruginosa]RKG17942.1 hypothetical protein CKA52_23555 [Pseudomonas aeruginosa]
MSSFDGSSHNRRKRVLPSRLWLGSSLGKYWSSQFLSLQRLKVSLNQFMLGLRGRAVWKQNDSTECPGATLRPG